MVEVPIIKIKLKDAVNQTAKFNDVSLPPDHKILKIHVPSNAIECIQMRCLKCHRDSLFHFPNGKEYFYGVKCGKCKTEVWGKERPGSLIYQNVIKKMNEAGLASGKNRPPVDLNLSYEERREKSVKETERIMNYFFGDMPTCPCCESVFSEWNFKSPHGGGYKCLYCKSDKMDSYKDTTKDHLEDEVYWFDD